MDHEQHEGRESAPRPPIQELIAAQARLRSDAVALTEERRNVTYGELWESAVRVAGGLAALGVRPGEPVALALPPGAPAVEAILGTLLAGAWYVPLDPRFPGERRSFIIEDSGCRLVVGTEPGAVSLAEVRAAAAGGPPPEVPARSTAYCLYTSGTTGRPKGVLVTHANVVGLLAAGRAVLDIGARDVWTQFHSCAFDFSVWEMFGCLSTGGRLVVPTRAQTQNPRAFLDLLGRERVSVLNQTPSAFARLVALDDGPGSLPELRYVIFGGERLAPRRLRDWHRAHPKTRLINMYGITEATVHSTIHELTPGDLEDDASPIGVPLPGTTIRLVDPHTADRPVPTGTPGEIWIEGAGVAAGYLRRPELDAERFVRGASGAGVALRTGDLARRTPDGDLLYVGRTDDQFQWHGYRIEPDEVADRLREHPAVGDAAVVLHGGAEGRIAAFLTPDGPAPSAEELHGHLARRLPPYMIPHVFATVPDLPLTENGKLDRPALTAEAATLRQNPTTHPQRPGAPRGRPAGGTEDVAESVPASAGQRQIHMADRLSPGAYDEAVAWQTDGRLDITALRSAVADLTARHEILRTRFAPAPDGLRQIPGPPWAPEVRLVRLAADSVRGDDIAASLIDSPPLDPRHGRTSQMIVLRPADGDDVLVLRQHHLVTDEASVRILMADLDRCYRAARAGEPAPPWTGPQFKDVVAAEQAGDDGPALDRLHARLTGALPALLPDPPPDPGPPGRVAIPFATTGGDVLRDAVRRLRVTRFTVIAAAVAAALHRWTGRPDVTFGVPLANRDRPELAGALGPYVSMGVLRSTAAPASTLTDILAAMRGQLADAVRDQHVPYEALVRRMRPARSSSAAPYCDVIVTPDEDEDGDLCLGGLRLTRREIGRTRQRAAYPVTVRVGTPGGRLAGVVGYDGVRLSARDAERLAAEIARCLPGLAAGPALPVWPDGPPEAAAPAAPATLPPATPRAMELETVVLTVWREVLDSPELGIEDNFFEAGGDSVLLAQVQERLAGELGRELPATVFFACPTVAALAAKLAEEAAHE
ncbi:amino acid adenylation domain-containing protein [Spongiactinospora sp. 9N601]|uniref:amino acid adenylation domain-containing protein n=1 Tax=Spongiactinospora sp. 9N601 TaxID=3375149 RepID=UPI0037BCFE34